MASTTGRRVIEYLTNKSGGGVIAGDVVIVDTTNDNAFTTTTTGGFTGTIGIAQETIASNAAGRVLTAGNAALVNVNASVTRGNFGKSHTVVKQATDAGASRVSGAFCQFLTGGTTPAAHLFGLADSTASASGHIAAATARRTSGNITLNSNTVAAVDTGLDITLAAATGDIVTVSANGLMSTEAIVTNFDVATIVSAAIVNYFGVGLASSNQGLLGWSKQAGVYVPFGGSATYVLQAGDISGGNVLLRLVYKTGSGNSTLFASSATAFQWSALLVRPV